MRNLVSTYVEQFRQDRQKQIRLVAILAALAVVVAGVVFWQLHNTGVAMSNEVYCGQEEHVHDENCYETTLVCGLDESEGHVHDDSCYETVETLICTDDSEDHVHTADCYETTQELICGLEEASGHTHTDDCCETVLVCDIPEHTHTIECMIDETADVETASDWEATLPEELSGVWADDMVAVAESQVGYTESTANFQLAEDGETRQGYTRYGAWYGNEYGDWDAMFASFCLNYAGVPEEEFPEASGSYAWITELEDTDMYVPGDDFTALPGDLVFFDTDEDGEADAVGIVKEIQEDADFVVNEETGETVTTTVVTVIEGNSEDAVQENEYRFDDAAIMGYGILPEQTTAESVVLADFDESVVDEDYDGGILTGEKNFLYEDDDLVLKVNVSGSVEIPESAVASYKTEDEDTEETADPSWEDITMEVAMAKEGSEVYKQMLAYAEEQEGELYQLFNVDLAFFYGEDEVDVSDCDITVEAAPTQALLQAAAPEQDENALVELGVTVAMLEAQEENIVELDSANVTSENPEDAALSADISGSDFGIMLLDDADPHFKVQFYANIDQILKQHKEGDTDLTVIETHTESGAVLPENKGSSSSNYNTSVVELKSNGSGGFKLDSETVLTEMYTAEEYEFVLEPDLHSMNKLEVNSDYTLKQIWVLKDEKNENSENKSDWDIYDVTSTQDPSTGEYSYNISFTNNESEAGPTTIYIADGSVFRFVYDASESDAYVTVNMFDYNIGDGNVYAGNSTSSGTWSSGTKYMYTAQQGINNTDNYSGTGVHLGFGNNNTHTGLQDLYWGDNQLNKYNINGLLGCTFGLVSELDEGNIQFASGVSAPDLFNEGTGIADAIGKEAFPNTQLVFDREGDTYTLTAVEAANINLNNLDVFTNPGSYTSIYTNNFWPLDEVTYNGMDPLFGGSSSVRYFGNNEGNMPASDDGEDHNSYFGMNFDIKFSYMNDYVGPLEYFFFGDDDMWVFLDDQLVLDIGGVHSSVGEHVDLWDYLASERDSLKDGEVAYHSLRVFYTERGASGSTCYISYTLPTVSSVTPVDNSGSLRVDKVVEGATAGTGEEFTFTLELRDENGEELNNLYNSIVYTNEAETEVENSYLLTSGSTFNLRDGWHIVIHNLPAGAVATVTETSRDGYSTTYEISAVGEEDNPIPDAAGNGAGTEASGEIYDSGITTIVFTNSILAELPNAGGTGTWIYTVAGVCLIGGAAGTFAYRKRRAVRSS